MADIQNASFEDPDLAWGQALYWDEACSECGEDVGMFWNGVRYVPFESFEGGWADNETGVASFALAGQAIGMFEQGSMAYEPFEYSWAGPAGGPPWNHQDVFVFDPDNFEGGKFNSLSDDAESFEEGWSNDNDVADFSEATTSTGSFDTDGTPEDVEDFEEGWQSNENDVADFDAATSSVGVFDTDGTPENYEDFEEGWTTTLP